MAFNSDKTSLWFGRIQHAWSIQQRHHPRWREAIATNLSPLQRPLILWLLRRAEQIVLTQASEQEQAALVKPGGVNGLLKRMGRG